MQYCFLASGPWSHNASAFRLRELGSALAEQGVRVTYVVDDVPSNRADLELHPSARVEFVPHPKSPSQFWERRRLLRRLDPDAVHVINPTRKMFLALAGSRFRVVADWDEWPAKRPHPLPTKVVELFLDRWLRNRAWLTVVASSFLAQQFHDRYGLNSVYVPNAVFPNNHPDGGSPYEEPTAVYMGNLYSAYDQDLVLKAALALKRRGKTPRVLIVGHGPDLESCRHFVIENDLTNVAFRGYLTGSDLWRHLRHAHVLLLPIRPTVLNRARCPMKTYSYAQSGRPVIANRVGEVPGVLGESASYVDPSPEAFADAIEEAFGAPLADVEYDTHLHTWEARGAKLLHAVTRAGPG